MAICTDPHFVADTVMSIAGVSLALMAVLLALFYMAGAFFKKAEYESFVSIEIYQLGVSAVMLVTIFSGSCLAAQIIEMFAGADPFQIGRIYLNYISTEIALKAVLALESVKLFAQYWGAITLRWGLAIWGVTVPSFPAYVVIERVADFLLLLITPFASSLMVQELILEAIRALALPFVLPAGVVLRIFPPTRDAGGFLIATAIGFQLVYPFTYVMHRDIVMGMIASEFGRDNGFEKTLGEYGYEDITLWSITEKGLFDIDKALFHPLKALSFLLLQALFLPALSMVLTVAFIKGTTKFISQKMT